MATVTPAGHAGDAALVVKGDGRVHGRTPLADWCDVHGVSMTTGKLDAICKVRTHDGSFFYRLYLLENFLKDNKRQKYSTIDDTSDLEWERRF